VPCTSNAQYELPLASSPDLVTERPALLAASKKRSTPSGNMECVSPSGKAEHVSAVGFWAQ